MSLITWIWDDSARKEDDVIYALRDVVEVCGRFNEKQVFNEYSKRSCSLNIKLVHLQKNYELEIEDKKIILDRSNAVLPCLNETTERETNVATIIFDTKNKIYLKFSKKDVFIRWNRALREAIADLKLTYAQRLDPDSNMLDLKALETAISECIVLIPFRHSSMERAHNLLEVKSTLHELKCKADNCSNLVTNEEIEKIDARCVVDPLLARDPQLQYLKDLYQMRILAEDAIRNRTQFARVRHLDHRLMDELHSPPEHSMMSSFQFSPPFTSLAANRPAPQRTSSFSTIQSYDCETETDVASVHSSMDPSLALRSNSVSTDVIFETESLQAVSPTGRVPSVQEHYREDPTQQAAAASSTPRLPSPPTMTVLSTASYGHDRTFSGRDRSFCTPKAARNKAESIPPVSVTPSTLITPELERSNAESCLPPTLPERKAMGLNVSTERRWPCKFALCLVCWLGLAGIVLVIASSYLRSHVAYNIINHTGTNRSTIVSDSEVFAPKTTAAADISLFTVPSLETMKSTVVESPPPYGHFVTALCTPEPCCSIFELSPMYSRQGGAVYMSQPVASREISDDVRTSLNDVTSMSLLVSNAASAYSFVPPSNVQGKIPGKTAGGFRFIFHIFSAALDGLKWVALLHLCLDGHVGFVLNLTSACQPILVNSSIRNTNVRELFHG